MVDTAFGELIFVTISQSLSDILWYHSFHLKNRYIIHKLKIRFKTYMSVVLSLCAK